MLTPSFYVLDVLDFRREADMRTSDLLRVIRLLAHPPVGGQAKPPELILRLGDVGRTGFEPVTSCV